MSTAASLNAVTPGRPPPSYPQHERSTTSQPNALQNCARLRAELSNDSRVVSGRSS